MGSIIEDGMLDTILEVNYPVGREEMRRKASEFSRTLREGGSLHLFMRNPRALRSRLKEGFGMEEQPAGNEDMPWISEVLDEYESAGLSLRKYEAVHPRKLYIPVDTPEAKRKMKLVGSVYRLARNVAPDSVASFYTAVFIK